MDVFATPPPHSCLLPTDRNVSPAPPVKCEQGWNPGNEAQLPHMDVDRTRTYLQLSLLHSSCLTRFYPSRIPDAGWESFLSASPSSLMPVLCLHPKHSSSAQQSDVDSRRISQGKYIFSLKKRRRRKKKLSQQGCGCKVFIFEVRRGSGVHLNEGQVNCWESLFSCRVFLNST